MNKKFTADQVREYWTNQALTFGQAPASSWSDQPIIDMEIREILKYLNEGDQVLDIGCANGYSTTQIAARKKIAIRGIDYIPEMINNAQQRLTGVGNKLLGNIEFDVGDITNLQEPTSTYDKVIVIRVIINLGEWNVQVKALHECVRVIKPGGLLLLSEATLQGWNNMNKFRREWNLPDIPMPAFNQYLDEEKVKRELSEDIQFIELVDFSSTYYVGTRVLKPLFIKALRESINVGDPDMEWNRWFSQLPSWGNYGTQRLFIFKK